jgi:hypothetical protein
MLFAEMTIDHILPKSLSEDPALKRETLKQYGLPEDFDFEGYFNWLPCHMEENRQKSDMIFPDPSLMFFLGIANKRAEIAANIERKWKEEKRKDTFRCQIQMAVLKKEITQEEAIKFVVDELPDIVYDTRIANEPIVIAFGVVIEHITKDADYTEEIVSDYPRLCDKLTQDLKIYLKSLVSCHFFVCEEMRDGESFAVRVAFENLDPDELDQFDYYPWNVIEIKWFSDLYNER